MSRLALFGLCLGLLPAVSMAVESPGERLYVQGLGEPQPQLRLADSPDRLPMSLFPCANCHGLDARGGKEAGVMAPAITWQQLSRPYSVTLANRRERPAYDIDSFHRLLTRGLDSGGQSIGPGMPRYTLSRDQSRQLQQYLETLGAGVRHDPASGVDADTIRIGLLHGVDDSPQLASAMHKTLDAWSKHINEQGGLFRRRFSVHAGDAAVLLSVDRRKGLFAVLTLYEEDAAGLRRQAPRLPVISAVAAAANERDWSWRLFPEPGAFLAQSRSPQSLIIGHDTFQDPAKLNDLLNQQSNRERTLLLALHPKFTLPEASRALLGQWQGDVLQPRWPTQADLGRYAQQRYEKLAMEQELPKAYRTEQLWLLACAQVLKRAMEASGRRLNRDRWRERLEELSAYDPLWTPPVTFVPPQRTGIPQPGMIRMPVEKGNGLPRTWSWGT